MANKVTYEIDIDSKGAVAGIKKVDNAIDGLDKNVSKSSKSMGGLMDLLKPSPMAIAAAAVTGIGIAFGFAAKKTMEFDKQMSSVKAVTNATDEDMAKLRETALKFGASTSFSATEAAKGLEFLGMAGFTAKQSIEALPGVLNLAAASGMELGRSADIASNILSQFQKPASETNNLVDLLAKTVTSSNQNMEQLADAMNYLGPTAAALKIPISEVSATIGTMANNGLQGSLGTRALGSSLVRLAKPTKQMKEVISNLNLEFFNQQGEFKGIIGLTKELERATEGMTDKEKQKTLATLFGAEAIQEMNILLATGSDKLQTYTNKLKNSEGAAKKMAEAKLDNLAGDFKLLNSAVTDLSIRLLETSQGGLRDIVQGFTSFITLLTENKDAIFNMFAPLKDNAKSVNEIVESFTKLINVFTGEDNNFLTLMSKGIKNISESINEVTTAIDLTIKAITEMRSFGKDLGKGFMSAGDEVASAFGFGSEEKKDPKLDPNYVPTDTELGFVEDVKADTTPVVKTNNIASDANTMASVVAEKQKTTKLNTNVEKVSGSKPTNITLNIGKLIENFSVNSTNVTESTAKIRDMVAEVLLTAVNDVNLIAE